METLSFKDFMHKLEKLLDGTEFDVVVGLGRGGILPAALASRLLDSEFGTIYFEMYGEGMPPKRIHEKPMLASPLSINVKSKRVLLVDDMCRSGRTLEAAAKHINAAGAASVTTLAVSGSGNADIVLFPSEKCVRMPW